MLAQTAKMHLEKAIEVAHREGCAVTEIEIAEHHYKLVRARAPARRPPAGAPRLGEPSRRPSDAPQWHSTRAKQRLRARFPMHYCFAA
jgi:hypothetical protein